MHSHVLNDRQIAQIHGASMRLLERVGVTVPHPDMLDRLEAAGAKVDRATQQVGIPESLVLDAVRQAGKRFTLYGRDLSRTAVFGMGHRNFNATAGQASWLEEPGGERRFAMLKDVGTAARFCDALGRINIASAMADPHDLPASVRCIAVLADLLRNTTKPVTFWYHDRASARYLNEILITLRGDEQRAAQYPVCYPFFEPISPLRFPFNGIDLLYETARLNLPVPIGPMAQMGLSAPATVAGTLAQQNAEILAGVVITQLIRSGMPVCYGGICHAFDMRTTQLIFAGPEQAIFGVAMTQMGKHYGLPVYINVGLSDSKRPDAQAGLESGITLAMGAAAGADIFGHMGISGVDQAASLDMLVLQDEVISYVESTLREFEVSDETLGLEVTKEIGPGGTFIDSEHTALHFRNELWFPGMLDRQYYQAWKDAGAPSLEQRCQERKEQILASHTVEPLPADVDREFDRILAAARRELVNH
jgi:trimethylamine--corrinoid protein Co-methyltransferase